MDVRNYLEEHNLLLTMYLVPKSIKLDLSYNRPELSFKRAATAINDLDRPGACEVNASSLDNCTQAEVIYNKLKSESGFGGINC